MYKHYMKNQTINNLVLLFSVFPYISYLFQQINIPYCFYGYLKECNMICYYLQCIALLKKLHQKIISCDLFYYPSKYMTAKQQKIRMYFQWNRF
jgi:hypothetical protein